MSNLLRPPTETSGLVVVLLCTERTKVYDLSRLIKSDKVGLAVVCIARH